MSTWERAEGEGPDTAWGGEKGTLYFMYSNMYVNFLLSKIKETHNKIISFVLIINYFSAAASSSLTHNLNK